jgi:hypothetical protein
MRPYLLTRVRKRGGDVSRYRKYGEQSIAPMNVKLLKPNLLFLEGGHGASFKGAVTSQRRIHDYTDLHIASLVIGVD